MTAQAAGSFAALEAALASGGVTGLLEALAADATLAEDDRRRLLATIRLSGAALARDPAQLAAQLLGRLDPVGSPALTALLEQARGAPASPWLRPQAGGLLPAGGDVALLLAGHVGAVRAIALTPDGALAVSASEDGAAHVWDIASGSARSRLSVGDATLITGLPSPDGSRIATIGHDNVARLWDAAGGAPLRALANVACWRNSAAFVDGGRRLLLALRSGAIAILDAATGELAGTLNDQRREITVLLAADAARRAVSFAGPDDARVWDLERGVVSARLPLDDLAVIRAALSADGRRLVAGTTSGELLGWDLDDAARPWAFVAHASEPAALALSPDGRLVASVARRSDRTVRVLDAASGQPVAALALPDTPTQALAFLPDGRLVSGSNDGGVRVWDVGRGVLLASWAGSPAAVRSLAVTPDGALLLAGFDDGALVGWHAPAPGDAGAAEPVGAAPSARGMRIDGSQRVGWPRGGPLVADNGGRWLVHAADRQRLIGDDLARGAPRWTREPAHPLTALAIDAANGHALWGDAEGRVVVAGLADGVPRSERQLADDTRVQALALAPDASALAVLTSDGFARVLDPSTLEEQAVVGEAGEPLLCAVFLPGSHGSRLVTGGRNQAVVVWDVHAGSALHWLWGHRSRVTRVGCTDDGRAVVSSAQDGTLVAWDPEFGDQLLAVDLRVPESRVPHASWATLAGTSRLVYALHDGQLACWDLDEGRRVDGCHHPGGRPLALAASPDGRWLLTAGADRWLRLWESASLALVAATAIDDTPTRCLVTSEGAVAASTATGGLLRFQLA